MKRVSPASFSESSHVFDPELLLGVIDELLGKLNPVGRDPRLRDLKGLLTIVDATLLKALPRMTQAMWADNCDGSPRHAWKLHTHFEIDRHVPVRVDVTGALNGGKSDEAAVLRTNLQPGRCYVLDRYFAQFALFNEVHAIGSSYVCRVRGQLHLRGERRTRVVQGSAGGGRGARRGRQPGNRVQAAPAAGPSGASRRGRVHAA